MSDLQVNNASAAGAASWQARQSQNSAAKTYPTLYEMMRDAREKAQATQDRFSRAKPRPRYGDLPVMAYARLARAKNAAQVNAAAGYARRQIAYLRSAKRTDPDNAKRIQAAINQLQKAVNRAGKKNRELSREKVDQQRQKKLAQERKLREARRQQHELRRKQTLRAMRESGYIREAEIDDRMQSQLAAADVKLRDQVQSLTASIQPSADVVARQYADVSAAAEASAAGEMDLQA